MFSNNGKISERQMIRLLVMDMFTGACLFLPMALPRTSGNGGFLAYVIGILLTWGYGWLVAKNVENSSMKKWLVCGKDVGALFFRGVYFFRYFASYVFLMGLFITVLQETFLYSMLIYYPNQPVYQLYLKLLHRMKQLWSSILLFAILI